MAKLLFADWFEAQHGPRQKNGVVGSIANYTDDDLEMAAACGKAAAAEIERRRLWDARRESALYAWQVEDK